MRIKMKCQFLTRHFFDYGGGVIDAAIVVSITDVGAIDRVTWAKEHQDTFDEYRSLVVHERGMSLSTLPREEVWRRYVSAMERDCEMTATSSAGAEGGGGEWR